MTFYETVFKSKMAVWGETCALISSFPRENVTFFKFKTLLTSHAVYLHRLYCLWHGCSWNWTMSIFIQGDDNYNMSDILGGSDARRKSAVCVLWHYVSLGNLLVWNNTGSLSFRPSSSYAFQTRNAFFWGIKSNLVSVALASWFRVWHTLAFKKKKGEAIHIQT